MNMLNQIQNVYWGKNDPHNRPEPTIEQKKLAVNDTNPNCPFFSFVGNQKAKKKLARVAFDALGKEDHLCRDLAFLFKGPASSGKTTLARKFAQILDLPFIEISPKSIKTSQDIFKLVKNALLNAGIPLVNLSNRNYYILPPCIIFIDEVHALSQNCVDGLLKATEHSDSILVTEDGTTVNCFNVCWMIATTETGQLFDAFKSRFSDIELNYLSKKDVAKIVKINFPEFDQETCELIAHYRPKIVRKTLEFAREMKLEYNMNPRSWSEIALEIAEDNNIHETGLENIQIQLLKVLEKQETIAINRLAISLERKKEEIEKNIVPALIFSTEDEPALIKVTSRGYSLTEAGTTFLSLLK